jgi:hypothetical protein
MSLAKSILISVFVLMLAASAFGQCTGTSCVYV